jgi:tRNA (cmo5U34)-methyltransferase
MPRPLHDKSSVDQIRRRFDADVERFSHLETGQQAAMDAVAILEVVAKTAACFLRPGGAVLDVGCGAGNFTLRVLAEVSPLDCTLLDLSGAMLARARERVSAMTSRGRVETVQADVRAASFADGSFDAILAGQVLHHLRGDAEWDATFATFHRWLRPGGALLVADLIAHDDPAVQRVMAARWANYLEAFGGAAYRDKVLGYTEEEDSPRSLAFQAAALRRAGFAGVEVLHKNAVFGAYYARRD